MNYETPIGDDSASTAVVDEYESENKQKKIYIIAAILLLLTGAAVYYFYNRSQETAAAEKAAAGEKAKGQTVSVIGISNQTVARTITTSGTIGARRDTSVGVVGEGGRVLRVFADAGDWVKKGQILVSIDRSVQNQQAAALQAQIGVAQADLQLAENELGRALQLVDRGFISKADVDRKTATRNAARARVNVARAQLNETRARNARLDIVAPVGGYVLERQVEPGQTVSSSSDMLFRIAKDGELELKALLSENDLSLISTGVEAIITPVGESRQFTGRIWQVSPIIDAQSRQGIARISIPFDRALRPGGFASVEIAAGATTAPILPDSAVLNDNKGSYIFIIDKDNKAVRRSVKTGKVTSNGVPILEGLKGNERIVVYAGSFLSQGETVTPKLVKID